MRVRQTAFYFLKNEEATNESTLHHTLLFIMALFTAVWIKQEFYAPNLASLTCGQGDNGIHAFAEKTTGDLQALPFSHFPQRGVQFYCVAPFQEFSLRAEPDFEHGFPVLTLTTRVACAHAHRHALPPTPACVSPAVCSNPTGVGINSGASSFFCLTRDRRLLLPASIFSFQHCPGSSLLTPVAGSPFAFASL